MVVFSLDAMDAHDEKQRQKNNMKKTVTFKGSALNNQIDVDKQSEAYRMSERSPLSPDQIVADMPAQKTSRTCKPCRFEYLQQVLGALESAKTTSPNVL